MRFYAEKKKQGKSFARKMSSWLQGRQFSDSQVATFISSSLTHMFIEIDLGKKELYADYHLLTQCQKLAEYVEGLLGQEDMRQFYKRIVGDEFTCSGPSKKTE